MIPVKGYATFHPLKHCMVGKNFSSSYFKKLSKNTKITNSLQRLADETEEDYLKFIEILKQFGVKTYRPEFNEEDYLGNMHGRPPVHPRDHFAVIGETFYAVQPTNFYGSILKQIDKKNLFLKNKKVNVNTSSIARVGKDLFWDLPYGDPNAEDINFFKERWESEGYRIHISNKGYHMDGCFSIVKPGCIVSLRDVHIEDYEKEFPKWDVLYLPDQSWSKIHPFQKIKEKVQGRWWIPGEENNEALIEFVESWMKDWVGYVEETVFDVNMLSIDENTIICNNYNKEVFNFFKKHKVEPIIFNFRHRYFWDGGVSCITQDFYREGKMEDYFG